MITRHDKIDTMMNIFRAIIVTLTIFASIYVLAIITG